MRTDLLEKKHETEIKTAGKKERGLETKRRRRKKGQCKYERGIMISLLQRMGNWAGSVLRCLTIIL